MDEPNKPKMDPQDELPGSPKEELLGEADEATELKKKLEEIEGKAAEYLSGWQRAKADFVNYKKDENYRFEELAKYSVGDMVKEFINVLDSFDLAIAALESKIAAPTPDGVGAPTKSVGVEKGVYMIRAQMEDVLKKRGLGKIEIVPGSAFDPAISEAMTEVESDYPEGTVVDEVETGYRLYEKVLRPARVRISKGKNK